MIKSNIQKIQRGNIHSLVAIQVAFRLTTTIFSVPFVLMKCIFCKSDASNSKSIEHIVPESLGNIEVTLDKGIVCDKCNNYFSRKVERPVLELEYFINLRSRHAIESKKGKVARGIAFIPKAKNPVKISFSRSRTHKVYVDIETMKLIMKGEVNSLMVPIDEKFPRQNIFVSRFLAKIALEILALMLIGNNRKHQNEFADGDWLEPVRNYARYNPKNENWPYSVRKIYAENEKFYRNDGSHVGMLFECDFLYTSDLELYFVIAIKGVEYVINMGGDSIEGYEEWLIANNHESPLYRYHGNARHGYIPEFMKA